MGVETRGRGHGGHLAPLVLPWSWSPPGTAALGVARGWAPPAAVKVFWLWLVPRMPMGSPAAQLWVPGVCLHCAP